MGILYYQKFIYAKLDRFWYLFTKIEIIFKCNLFVHFSYTYSGKDGKFETFIEKRGDDSAGDLEITE